MAEGFEPYHVPQQSRRDKLREVVQNHPGCVEHLQGCAGLAPLYEPSLYPSDLLTCANLQHPNNPLVETHKQTTVKEGVNLMGFVGGIINASSSSPTSQHIYMDPQPQSSIHIDPGSFQGINTNPFLFAPQNLRAFDQTFNGGVYRPEPLSMTHEANTTGQGLSLSLSSHQTHHSSLPLELNLQRYEPSIFSDKGGTGAGGCIVPAIVGGGGSTSTDLSRSSVPLGPFTGYASILKGSRFLKPAQQLLEELCDVGRGIYAEKITVESSLMDSPAENFAASGIVDESRRGGDGGGERRSKKWRLISMLDEVYKRYKYYYQQMQSVIASFESVAGLSNAAPYANLALKTMSKHFRSLKNAITDQLQFTSQAQSYRKGETPKFGYSDGLHSQRPVHNSRFLEHQPVWRPQRGLPERAVTVLRAWLFEHFLHPYPTDTDKLMLAKQTGLSRNQVSNWFINARVRLWKPMVEEIHSLETRQAQKASEQITDRPRDHLPPASTSLASENSSAVTNWDRDLPAKHFRIGFPDISMGTEEEQPMNLSYENLPQHQHGGVCASAACGGGGGVSLTLGLHQNNGIGLSEPFPINSARRFGLDGNGGRYVMGSFEAQNRQFGRDFIGGQLLQDFVG